MQTRLMAQERLLSTYRMMLIPLLTCLVMMGGTGAHALEVETSYSFPHVGEWAPPPAGLVEGAILATFSGDEPMGLLSSDGSLEQVNSNTWTYLFPWDWVGGISATFLSSLGDTVTVTASPEPVVPFGSQTHQLPTFHITTARAGLWDPAIGIYVYGDNANFLQHGVEWERLAQVDYFNPGDQFSFSEPIGLRVHGGWSRRFDQKSFRFYFDDYGSSQEINYDFFGGDPTNFERLLLRTHRFPFNCFNSDLLESIWLDEGHLGSRMSPAVAYVNNEFWGVYSLRERLDDEFLEVTHGIEPGSYTYIKDGIVERGDPFDWANTIASFAAPQNYASHSWFQQMSAKVDLPTYVDWLILNIFSASADNGFDANLAQLKQGDGPWKIIMWDEDDTFFAQNLNDDMFRFYASADQAAFEANWPTVFYYDAWDPTLQAWCDMFRGFMQNSEFKAFFFDRLDELLATELAPSAIAARVDAIVAEQGSEMELHAQRWNWSSAAEFTDHADRLKSWTSARQGIVRDQALAFREEFRAPVELVNFQATTESDGVHLAWETRGERDCQGYLLLRENPDGGEPLVIDSFFANPELLGQGSTDETFTYTTVDSEPLDGVMNHYYLVWLDSNYTALELPWTESVWVAGWDGLVFNEFMADNDSTLADNAGEFDDWIEIYNGSAATVFLDSLYITDDLAAPTRHRLVGGFKLVPGDHLLLWADGAPEQGYDHLGFRLSVTGEGLYLFAPDGETLITSYEYGSQVADVSLAREVDGSAAWVYSAAPTPADANGDPHTQTLLRINEFMGAGGGGAVDEAGESDPWVEIFNPLPVPISLDQLRLKLTSLSSGVWDFADQEIPPGHHLLWLDGQPEQGEFHAPFFVGPSFGALDLSFVRPNDQIDLLIWHDTSAIGSIARVPDGWGPWANDVVPTPGSANPPSEEPNVLFINEFMALNGSIISDETGAFEDWVEIYNPGQEAVSLAGMYLTDDMTQSTQWAFPDTTINPGEFLLVWCDDDTLDGPLHANFKLSSSGESIALFSSLENGNLLIDGYTFGVQSNNVSEGRIVDGAPGWDFLNWPSPGSANSPISAVTPDVVTEAGLQPNYPNPFNPRTTIVFALDRSSDVVLSVHDLRGRLVSTLVHEWRPAGQHQVIWDGTTSQGAPVASGVYLVRIKAGALTDSRRMLLVK